MVHEACLLGVEGPRLGGQRSHASGQVAIINFEGVFMEYLNGMSVTHAKRRCGSVDFLAKFTEMAYQLDDDLLAAETLRPQLRSLRVCCGSLASFPIAELKEAHGALSSPEVEMPPLILAVTKSAAGKILIGHLAEQTETRVSEAAVDLELDKLKSSLDDTKKLAAADNYNLRQASVYQPATNVMADLTRVRKMKHKSNLQLESLDAIQASFHEMVERCLVATSKAILAEATVEGASVGCPGHWELVLQSWKDIETTCPDILVGPPCQLAIATVRQGLGAILAHAEVLAGSTFEEAKAKLLKFDCAQFQDFTQMFLAPENMEKVKAVLIDPAQAAVGSFADSFSKDIGAKMSALLGSLVLGAGDSAQGVSWAESKSFFTEKFLADLALQLASQRDSFHLNFVAGGLPKDQMEDRIAASRSLERALAEIVAHAVGKHAERINDAELEELKRALTEDNRKLLIMALTSARNSAAAATAAVLKEQEAKLTEAVQACKASLDKLPALEDASGIAAYMAAMADLDGAQVISDASDSLERAMVGAREGAIRAGEPKHFDADHQGMLDAKNTAVQCKTAVANYTCQMLIQTAEALLASLREYVPVVALPQRLNAIA